MATSEPVMDTSEPAQDMELAIDPAKVTDSALTHVITIYLAIKYLLDTTPNGESVSLPPIILSPGPARVEWIHKITRMAIFFQDFARSYDHELSSPEALLDFDNEDDRQDDQEEAIKAIKARAPDGDGKKLSANDSIEIVSREMAVLEIKGNFLAGAWRLIEKAKVDAVEALRLEMEKWDEGTLNDEVEHARDTYALTESAILSTHTSGISEES